MKNNNKGFTLIESIVTFAILTVAGIMFMFAFTNVSTLMSEGAMIKDETNNLYQKLQAEVKPTNAGNKSIILTLSDGTRITQDGITVQSQEGEAKEGIKVRLSRFVTNKDVGWVPAGPVIPEIYYDAKFYILQNLARYPSNLSEFDKYINWGSFVSSDSLFVPEAINDKIGMSNMSIFDENFDFEKYFKKSLIPTDYESILQSLSYKDALTNGYDVYWIGVKKPVLEWVGAVQKNVMKVYGVLLPKGKNLIILPNKGNNENSGEFMDSLAQIPNNNFTDDSKYRILVDGKPIMIDGKERIFENFEMKNNHFVTVIASLPEYKNGRVFVIQKFK